MILSLMDILLSTHSSCCSGIIFRPFLRLARMLEVNINLKYTRGILLYKLMPSVTAHWPDRRISLKLIVIWHYFSGHLSFKPTNNKKLFLIPYVKLSFRFLIALDFLPSSLYRSNYNLLFMKAFVNMRVN